ncbi:MAG TPA: nucleotide exchange factor GrpE [Gemmatimonadales bacterium]|jgi:molecular chaperone GrpE|nr:nucleotide exchange factor GrpE [Gemmatimonadales bacterium]
MFAERSGGPEDPDGNVPAAEPGFSEQEWGAGDSVPAASAARAIADAEDRFLRLAAEYDNYRKRTLREKTEAFDRGAAATVARILDVLDDIDRLATSGTPAEALQAGFELVQKKLAKDLEAAGLERIDPVGARFDPTEQEAVAVVAPESPAQDHTVKATFQVGYRFKGTVIRPARVQVYSEQGTA